MRSQRPLARGFVVTYLPSPHTRHAARHAPQCVGRGGGPRAEAGTPAQTYPKISGRGCGSQARRCPAGSCPCEASLGRREIRWGIGLGAGRTDSRRSPVTVTRCSASCPERGKGLPRGSLPLSCELESPAVWDFERGKLRLLGVAPSFATITNAPTCGFEPNTHTHSRVGWHRLAVAVLILGQRRTPLTPPKLLLPQQTSAPPHRTGRNSAWPT